MIYLIRHGETASNAARIVQVPETPLSPRGMAQADHLARRLAARDVRAIVSSDLARAAMTAEAIRAETGAPLSFDPDLQERNYGDIRGQAYATLGVNILAPDYNPPGGEHWDTFHARVDVVWRRVADLALQTDGGLAVVTHGLVCYSLALHHLRMPDGVTPPTHWANASLTEIESQPPWQVRLLNCATHLDAMIADDTSAPSSG